MGVCVYLSDDLVTQRELLHVNLSHAEMYARCLCRNGSQSDTHISMAFCCLYTLRGVHRYMIVGTSGGGGHDAWSLIPLTAVALSPRVQHRTRFRPELLLF